MSTILLPLVLVTSWVALAAGQQMDDATIKLLLNVFGTPPTNNVLTTVTTVPSAKKDNLNDMVLNLFNNLQPVKTSTTYLGTNNKPNPESENCECVPYYQCSNGIISREGIGLVDPRLNFGPDSSAFDVNGPGPCGNPIDVCCLPPDIVAVAKWNAPQPPNREGCGHRQPDGIGFRIIGNSEHEAQYCEFPWMVAIFKEELISPNKDTPKVFKCGGSLIHKQAVLTAAHCVRGKQPNQLSIRAGDWDMATQNELYPHQDRTVQDIVVHEKYHAGALYYDVAILILSEPVEFAANVDVVCLPDQDLVFDGSRCFTSGWGKENFHDKNRYQVILKKVELPVVPHAACQSSLRNTRLGKYYLLHNSFICAGGEDKKDACEGDGGSPLVCPIRNDPTRYMQAGIVSWGIGCGDNGTPGVYANIAHVRNWIDKQMASHNLDNTAYIY